LYKESCSRELRCTIYGKPFTDLFELAQRSLEQKLARRELDAIYMIGDNPKSDIRGANAMGGKWFSILVRTGVFKGAPGDNDEANPAKFVCDHVGEAIKFVLQKHGM
jgi:ribonucleotide monophosphatase NagD (HAD superfamily)